MIGDLHLDIFQTSEMLSSGWDASVHNTQTQTSQIEPDCCCVDTKNQRSRM